MRHEIQDVMQTEFHAIIKLLALLLPIVTAAVVVTGLVNGESVDSGFFIVLSFGVAFAATTYWVFATKVLLNKNVVREEPPFPPGLRSPIEIRHEAVRQFKFHTGAVYVDGPDARVHVRMGMTDWHHFTREAYIRACQAQGRRVPISGNPIWERQAFGSEEEIDAAIAERRDA